MDFRVSVLPFECRAVIGRLSQFSVSVFDVWTGKGRSSIDCLNFSQSQRVLTTTAATIVIETIADRTKVVRVGLIIIIHLTFVKTTG